MKSSIARPNKGSPPNFTSNIKRIFKRINLTSIPPEIISKTEVFP